MTSSAARALIVGHGDFAAGLVSAVAQITGRGGELLAISNASLSAQDLEATIRDLIAESGATVIFTDLPAGSAAFAARKVGRTSPALTVVAGTNLAVLLDFLLQTGVVPGVAARHAVERGRGAMAILSGGGTDGG